MLCTENSQIFREINVPVIKFNKYLLRNYENWLSNCMNKREVFENTCNELKFQIKFNKVTCIL